MTQRALTEARAFSTAVHRLIPDRKEADEILESATLFFSCEADSGELIAGTNVRIKIVSDIPHKRHLAIFYTINSSHVFLRDIKEF